MRDATMPATFSLAQIIYQLQTQFGGSYEDTYRSWAGPTVYYSIPTTAPDAQLNETAGFDGAMMTSHKRAMAREAFELWDDLIAINLTETTAATGNTIAIAYSSTTDLDDKGNPMTYN